MSECRLNRNFVLISRTTQTPEGEDLHSLNLDSPLNLRRIVWAIVSVASVDSGRLQFRQNGQTRFRPWTVAQARTTTRASNLVAKGHEGRCTRAWGASRKENPRVTFEERTFKQFFRYREGKVNFLIKESDSLSKTVSSPHLFTHHILSQ